jgi:hypothetical protein
LVVAEHAVLYYNILIFFVVLFPFTYTQFVESQVLGRAIEVGDRIGAPTRWQHPSPLRVKPVAKGHLDGSKSKSTWR